MSSFYNEKIRIMFFMPSMRGGGAEKVVSELINNIDKSIFDVSLLLVKKEGPFLDKINKEINIYDLKSNRVSSSFFKTIFFINKVNPNILFVSHADLNLFVSLESYFFNSSIKIFYRETSIPSIRNRFRKYHFFYDILYKHFLKNAKHIILQSYVMYADLILNYKVSNNKLNIINNPVSSFKIDESFSFLDTSKRNIVSIGRLSYVKNHIELIKVFNEMDLNDTLLHIFGEGEERTSIEEYIYTNNLKDKVILHGFKKDVFRYITKANCMVLTSKYEGFANVILESLKVGIPCLAYEDLGGVKESIVDGYNGFIIKRSSDDLKNKIIKALNYKWDHSSIKKSVISFDIKVIVKKYEDLFWSQTYV